MKTDTTLSTNEKLIEPLDVEPIQERSRLVSHFAFLHCGEGYEAHQDRKALLDEVLRLLGELDKLNAKLEDWENQ